MDEMQRRDSPALRAFADRVKEQHRRTHDEIDRIEFLLGRDLSRGEKDWVHRRLHHGLRVPDDAGLDFDFETLDAAYRERLARSNGPWRGALDDIPPELQDLFPD
ncbi:MAG: hypothetical protein WD771_01610 [Gemmatimonadaceae bacterium]